MYKRQIQKTGGSSHSIVLPKEWIDRQQITSNDEILIHESYTHYLILTKNISLTVNCLINVDSKNPAHLRREILAHFINGADEISIISNSQINHETRRQIKETCPLLFGFEIFEDESQKVTLKNVAQNKIPNEIYVLKMITNIISMFQDLSTSIQTRNLDIATDIIDRDQEIDRINLLIMRNCFCALNNLGIYENNQIPLKLIYYYEHESIRLERIADHIVKVASSITNTDLNKVNFDSQLNQELNETLNYLINCKELLITKSIEIAHLIIDQFDTSQRNNHKSFNLKEHKGIMIVINDSLDRIKSYVANVAESTINILIP